MPEQLLDNLDVRSARPQESRAGVAERMPPDFLGDADTSCSLTDSISHERLVPVRLSPSAVRAGEDPVTRSLVLRVSPML